MSRELYMVKFGICEVACENRDLVIQHRSNIANDSRCWATVGQRQCQHWRITIDALTRNTFTPWGEPDEISYRINIICTRCNRSVIAQCGATSFNTKSDSWRQGCCNNFWSASVRLTSNSVEDIKRNINEITQVFK